MIKPRIKGKWSYSLIWGSQLKWSHNGHSWFHGVNNAIEDYHSDILFGIKK